VLHFDNNFDGCVPGNRGRKRPWKAMAGQPALAIESENLTASRRQKGRSDWAAAFGSIS
jgi:hypothetical protein